MLRSVAGLVTAKTTCCEERSEFVWEIACTGRVGKNLSQVSLFLTSNSRYYYLRARLRDYHVPLALRDLDRVCKSDTTK
jgi:hypothetical protein